MGLAVITENIGEGLYKIRPQFDITSLDQELSKLNAIKATYITLLSNAINTRDQLQNDTILAEDAINAVIEQWKAELIRRGQEQPGELVPDNPLDPATALPWEDTDRAQEAPLLAEINTARMVAGSGTVSRDGDLDEACLAHLRYQAGNGQIGHIGAIGSKARERAGWAGYLNPSVLHEVLAYGPRTPVAASQKMLRSNADELLDVAATKAGVAHVYSAYHVGSYLWAVIVASDEGPTIDVVVEDDPAKDAAEKSEKALDVIKKPEIDSLKPEKLGDAVKKFAIAKQKYLAAQREVERLMAEKLIRDQRISELETLKTTLENLTPIDCWCCTYTTNLEIGSTVKTMEVPGWYKEESTTKLTTLFDNTSEQRNAIWEERSINIAARGTGTELSYGKLHHSDVMTDAAVAYNYAMEPGLIKWKPIWRYGIITVIGGNYCTVALTETNARMLAGDKKASELSLNEDSSITNVPIIYPPCNGNIFLVGDEVVVEFAGFDRTKPAVIGFRREPKACPPRRVSWEQIQ